MKSIQQSFREGEYYFVIVVKDFIQ